MVGRKELIESILSRHFDGVSFRVENFSQEHAGHDHAAAESHFKVIFDKSSLPHSNRLALHRQVNDLLADEFLKGLHALSIQIQ